MNIDFEEIVVDIRKPQRFDNLRKIGEFSPPKAVPVLVEDNTVISGGAKLKTLLIFCVTLFSLILLMIQRKTVSKKTPILFIWNSLFGVFYFNSS